MLLYQTNRTISEAISWLGFSPLFSFCRPALVCVVFDVAVALSCGLDQSLWLFRTNRQPRDSNGVPASCMQGFFAIRSLFRWVLLPKPSGLPYFLFVQHSFLCVRTCVS